MKLHIRHCTGGCKRASIRLEGDNEWCHVRRFNYLDEVRQHHEVMSEATFVCAECQTKVTPVDEAIALAAGMVC